MTSQHLGRAAFVGATVLGAWCTVSALLWAAAAAALATIRAPGPISLDAAAVLPAAGLAWLCLTWLVVGVLLVCTTTTPALASGRAARLNQRITPLFLRRLTSRVLTLSLGAALATAPVLVGGPAQADVRSLAVAGEPVPGLDRPAIGLAVVGSFDRPAEDDLPVSAPPTQPRRGAGQRVVVHRGDTLWDIAARQLGPGAQPGEIAREWPRWHTANRAVIGSDPRRLRPGQVLVPPPTALQHHKERR